MVREISPAAEMELAVGSVGRSMPEDVAKARAHSPEEVPRRQASRPQPDKALSAVLCGNVAEAGRYRDGNGLHLFVQFTETRSWAQRLVVQGRRRELGLDAAGLVSLAEARELALANRRLARSGGDPFSENQRLQVVR